MAHAAAVKTAVERRKNLHITVTFEGVRYLISCSIYDRSLRRAYTVTTKSDISQLSSAKRNRFLLAETQEVDTGHCRWRAVCRNNTDSAAGAIPALHSLKHLLRHCSSISSPATRHQSMVQTRGVVAYRSWGQTAASFRQRRLWELKISVWTLNSLKWGI